MNAGISKETLERLARESGLYIIRGYWPDFDAICWPSNRAGYYDVIVKWYHAPTDGDNLRTRSDYPLGNTLAIPDMLAMVGSAPAALAPRVNKFITLLSIEARP